MNDAVWSGGVSTSSGLTYFGGAFTSLGNHIVAKGINWVDIDGGTDGDVLALNTFHGEMSVGGSFTTVGGGTLASRAWARYSETGVPWIASEPTSASASTGGSVTLTARRATGYTGLTYQWYRFNEPLVDGPTGNVLKLGNTIASGSTISGARSATLGIQNVAQGDAGQYRVIVSNSSGSDTSVVATLTVDGVTAAPLDGASMTTLFESLGPNPTGGVAQLAFRLERPANVRMHVHDVAGRLVRTSDVGHLAAGRHTTSWDGATGDGAQVSAGLYFVSLEAAGKRIGTRRLVMER